MRLENKEYEPKVVKIFSGCRQGPYRAKDRRARD
jgi:hypothetical protein